MAELFPLKVFSFILSVYLHISTKHRDLNRLGLHLCMAAFVLVVYGTTCSCLLDEASLSPFDLYFHGTISQNFY